MTSSTSTPTTWALRGARILVTLPMVAAAIWAALRLWDHYARTRPSRVQGASS